MILHGGCMNEFRDFLAMDADARPVRAGIGKLDVPAFRDFLARVYQRALPDADAERIRLLQDMNLATEEGFLNLACALLFTAHPEWIVPQFPVRAARFPPFWTKHGSPMMYEVIITPAAEEDYHEILRYLEDALHTHQAIAAFVERLAEVMEHLQTTPEMYEYSRETRLRAKGYRKFLVGNYVVLYLSYSFLKGIVLGNAVGTVLVDVASKAATSVPAGCVSVVVAVVLYPFFYKALTAAGYYQKRA